MNRISLATAAAALIAAIAGAGLYFTRDAIALAMFRRAVHAGVASDVTPQLPDGLGAPVHPPVRPPGAGRP